MYLQHSLLEEAIRDAAIELFYLHQLKSASLIWGNNQERQFNIYTCSFINTWLSNGYQNTRKILIIWYGAHCWTWWIEINDKYIFIFILYLKYYTICIYDWTQFLSFNILFLSTIIVQCSYRYHSYQYHCWMYDNQSEF